MRVLVTGASGFIGGHLAERLVREGDDVRALVRQSSDTSHLAALGVDLVQGDLFDHRALRRATDGREAVYHLAAARMGASRADLRRTNQDGTHNLMRAACEAAVGRVVYCSTAAVHGRRPPLPTGEDAPTRPHTQYAATRLAGEEIVRSYAARYALHHVIARPTATFGPRTTGYLSFFRDVVAGRIRLVGGGRHRYHLSYVDDVAAALALCGRCDVEAGSVYIVGTDEVGTIGELVRTIADGAGVESRYRTVPATPLAAAALLHHAITSRLNTGAGQAKRPERLTRDTVFRVGRAKRELGFSPAVSVRDGVHRTLAWHVAAGHLPALPAAHEGPGGGAVALPPSTPTNVRTRRRSGRGAAPRRP